MQERCLSRLVMINNFRMIELLIWKILSMICQRIEYAIMSKTIIGVIIALNSGIIRVVEYLSKAIVRSEDNMGMLAAEDWTVEIDHLLLIDQIDLIISMLTIEKKEEEDITQAMLTWKEMDLSKKIRDMVSRGNTIMDKDQVYLEIDKVSLKQFKISTHTIMEEPTQVRISTGHHKFSRRQDPIIKLKFFPINRKQVISILKIYQMQKLIWTKTQVLWEIETVTFYQAPFKTEEMEVLIFHLQIDKEVKSKKEPTLLHQEILLSRLLVATLLSRENPWPWKRIYNIMVSKSQVKAVIKITFHLTNIQNTLITDKALTLVKMWSEEKEAHQTWEAQEHLTLIVNYMEMVLVLFNLFTQDRVPQALESVQEMQVSH